MCIFLFPDYILMVVKLSLDKDDSTLALIDEQALLLIDGPHLTLLPYLHNRMNCTSIKIYMLLSFKISSQFVSTFKSKIILCVTQNDEEYTKWLLGSRNSFIAMSLIMLLIRNFFLHNLAGHMAGDTHWG